jgi:hypothetical protein
MFTQIMGTVSDYASEITNKRALVLMVNSATVPTALDTDTLGCAQDILVAAFAGGLF